MEETSSSYDGDFLGFSRKKKQTTNGAAALQEIDQSQEKKQVEIPLAPDPWNDFYNMNHEKRGTAVIFNHKEYQDDFCSPRYGTEKDRDALKDILGELGFDVIVYNDPNIAKILEVLESVSKQDHSNADCLVIAVMTHGKLGKLYAHDGPYPIHFLWQLFKADVCPSLAAKPKLFFIQACRGEQVDNGATVKYKSESDSSEENLYTIPAMSDILVMYSTVEGYYAWRDPQMGSPFVQSLATQLKKGYKEKDILSILTFVNRQVAIEFQSIEPGTSSFNDKKEMCSIVSMLTRLLKFK